MNKNKLIIIDDDRMVLQSLKREILSYSSSRNFEPFFFASPQQALDFARHNTNIGLMITDQRMPRMSGNELINSIRKVNPDISAIMISAYTDRESMKKSISSGVVSYIDKPWDSTQLMSEIQRGLEIHKLKRIQRTYIGRMNRELQGLGKFQMSLMGRNLPYNKRVNFSYKILPAPPCNCSSHFYHVHKINESSTVYILGDTGEPGLSSSSLTYIAKTLIKEFFYQSGDLRMFSPRELLEYLNRKLCLHLGSMAGKGIQCSIVFFDFEFRNLTAAGTSGMTNSIFRNPAFISLDTQGHPLGIDKDNQYEETLMEIQSQDRVLLYSNGLSLIQKQYGYLNRTFLKHKDTDNFTDSAFEEIKVLMKGKPQYEDYVLMSLKIKE